MYFIGRIKWNLYFKALQWTKTANYVCIIESIIFFCCWLLRMKTLQHNTTNHNQCQLLRKCPNFVNRWVSGCHGNLRDHFACMSHHLLTSEHLLYMTIHMHLSVTVVISFKFKRLSIQGQPSADSHFAFLNDTNPVETN